MMKPRYSIYLPACYRGAPRFDGSAIMRFAEQSRPAYCIIDRETVRDGGNRYLPHHVCPVIVSEGHEYIEAVKLCRKMNEEDDANKLLCTAI